MQQSLINDILKIFKTLEKGVKSSEIVYETRIMNART